MNEFERQCRHIRQALLDAEIPRGSRIVVAYSGGIDSTALVLALRALRPTWRVLALHVDHGLDPDSPRRRDLALANAHRLGVPTAATRLDPAHVRHHPHGIEAGARAARYASLERHAVDVGARAIATGHHADDQAETVLLRLLSGSGIAGLAGIAPIRMPTTAATPIVRPLLGLRRDALARMVVEAGLEPGLETCDDPNNRDLRYQRNHVRHRLLPTVQANVPDVVPMLARLADTARHAARHVDRRLDAILEPRPLPAGLGCAVSRAALDRLPPSLFVSAVRRLHHHVGIPYPPPRAACEALRRQLRESCHRGGRVGCDCGQGWRWEGDAVSLRLVPRLPLMPRFAYTVDVPGVARIEALGLNIRIARRDRAAWMFQSSPRRAAFVARDLASATVVVRNRRPGDRIQPLGAGGERRLKDVLIDKRYPRHLRDRLPLLSVNGQLIWIPGITIDQRFRIDTEQRVWVAEFSDADPEASAGH